MDESTNCLCGRGLGCAVRTYLRTDSRVRRARGQPRITARRVISADRRAGRQGARGHYETIDAQHRRTTGVADRFDCPSSEWVERVVLGHVVNGAKRNEHDNGREEHVDNFYIL